MSISISYSLVDTSISNIHKDTQGHIQTTRDQSPHVFVHLSGSQRQTHVQHIQCDSAAATHLLHILLEES